MSKKASVFLEIFLIFENNIDIPARCGYNGYKLICEVTFMIELPGVLLTTLVEEFH